jgi:beta-1,4-N-acetylglucosaminyltransferase
MRDRTYFIRHSERDIGFFLNLWEALKILRCERPRLILSTGAGPVVPFAIVGRLLGIPTLFIESVCRVSSPSLTGRIMHRITQHFFYQHEGLRRYFPRGTYGGPLI